MTEHCTMCRHPHDSHRIDPETGYRPCRSIGHPKGLNCTDCERITSPEHIAAIADLRNDDDPVLTAAFGAYITTLDHVRRQFGDAHQAFFTDVHESAVASALLEIRRMAQDAPTAPASGCLCHNTGPLDGWGICQECGNAPQDAPTAPAQPATEATGDTETTGSAGGDTGELSALRDRIAQTFILWSRARITTCEHTRFVEFGTAADAVMDVIRPVLESYEQARADAWTIRDNYAAENRKLITERNTLTQRAEQAEAALERARHLHRKAACRCGRDHDLGCQGCLSTTYPCPTIHALTTQDGQ